MQVAIAVDERYVVGARHLLTSLSNCWRGPGELAITAIVEPSFPTDALTSHARQSGLRIDFRQVNRNANRLPLLRYLTHATYQRLFLPDLLPEIDKVLYLDVDVVMMRDPGELFDVDLGDAPLAAARDQWQPSLCATLGSSGVDVSSFAPDAWYFNAGVMLVNLRQWRREGLTARAVRWLEERPTAPEGLEQDALNALTADRWLVLDQRWNVFPMTDFVDHADGFPPEAQLGYDDHAALERGAYALHFVGPEKPWSGRYPATRNLERYQRFTASQPSAGHLAHFSGPPPGRRRTSSRLPAPPAPARSPADARPDGPPARTVLQAPYPPVTPPVTPHVSPWRFWRPWRRR